MRDFRAVNSADAAGTIALVVAGVTAFAAIQRLPYAYYSLSRIIVFVSAGYAAWWFWQRTRAFAALIAVAAALLFNPISPMRMRRAEWQTFDLLTGVVMLALAIYAWKVRRASSIR